MFVAGGLTTRLFVGSVLSEEDDIVVKMKWEPKTCGCVKANLPSSGHVLIACERHRGCKTKRKLAYFDADGIVRYQ